ncbi:MAG: histidinol dehydrogenase, partial [Terriglobales bacterium]
MRTVRGRAVKREVERLAARTLEADSAVATRVRRIVTDVRRRGDTALRRYAERWDGLERDAELRVSR